MLWRNICPNAYQGPNHMTTSRQQLPYHPEAQSNPKLSAPAVLACMTSPIPAPISHTDLQRSAPKIRTDRLALHSRNNIAFSVAHDCRMCCCTACYCCLSSSPPVGGLSVRNAYQQILCLVKTSLVFNYELYKDVLTYANAPDSLNIAGAINTGTHHCLRHRGVCLCKRSCI